MGSDALNSAATTISNSQSVVNAALDELQQKNNELANKKNIQLDQLKEIEDKEKLLLTRSRMLQIAQDRNAYKKKIIYTLIAAIFIIFIFTLVTYVFFVRKINMAKSI